MALSLTVEQSEDEHRVLANIMDAERNRDLTEAGELAVFKVAGGVDYFVWGDHDVAIEAGFGGITITLPLSVFMSGNGQYLIRYYRNGAVVAEASYMLVES